MKITYVSSFDPSNINSYSGTGYYIPLKLKESGDTIEFIGNLSELNPVFERIKRKGYAIFGKNYLVERNPVVLQKWAEKIVNDINPDSDIILGHSSQPFAKLNISKPKVFWTDAVFASMVNYYKEFSDLPKESYDEGQQMEHEALHNVTLAVFSSEWAAKEAVKHYPIDREKVRVVPFGANIEDIFSFNQLSDVIKNKSLDTCKLLFIGVDWHRKGGDIAVEITKDLIRKNVKAELAIIGVDPGKEVKKLNFVKYYGYISKATVAGKKLFNQLINESHFLVLPSRADCTPIVFNEMNAYGIPVISTNEGGIPGMIENEVNGHLFNRNAEITEYSDYIIDLIGDKKKYIDLAFSSHERYINKLSWNQSIKSFRSILNELI